MKIKKNNILLFILVLILFFLGACFITYPLVFNLKTLATGVGDEFVIAWVQNWVINRMLSGQFFSVFDGTAFFPFHNTFAYTETFITSSIFASPFLALLKEPIVTVNVTLISSLTLLGFSTYLLSFYLTKNTWAALLSGVLIIFSPAVLDKATHLQILGIEWVPLAILFFLKFIELRKSKYLAISLLFFLLQMYNSFLPGYFILFSYVIILFYNFRNDKEKTIKLFTKNHVLFFLVTFALIIPIVIPYFQVAQEFKYARDIRDAVHLALEPEDLLFPSHYTRLDNFLYALPFNQHSQNSEFKVGYLGFVFSLLTILTFIFFLKNIKKKIKYLSSFITLGLVGLIVSFGPVLHLGRHTVHMPFIIPLPYMLFYYVLPGFQGFRNSARWEMLFILAMAVAISIMLTITLKKVSSKKKIILYILLFSGCFLEFNYPMQLFPIPQKKDFPPIYRWLNTTPKNSAVVFLPAYNWNMPFVGEEIRRDYFSTIEFRKSINGYSGFSPPPWQKLLVTLNEKFPDNSSVAMLKNMGVEYIIIDEKDYDNNFKSKYLTVNGITVLNKLKKNSSLIFIKKVGDYYVFKFIN